jgi:hypothetical protein
MTPFCYSPSESSSFTIQDDSAFFAKCKFPLLSLAASLGEYPADDCIFTSPHSLDQSLFLAHTRAAAQRPPGF